MNNNQFQNIKKPWIEGSGTLCFGIPSEIVKKLKLNQHSFLLIDLVDDSIIVIKKVNPRFTKTELDKVIVHENNIQNKNNTVNEVHKSEQEFKNPLDGLNL